MSDILKRYAATDRLWTDAELAAAHALVSSVMTPAEPQRQSTEPEPVILLLPITPKREAFEGRERQRRRILLYRRKNPGPRIGSRDSAGIWSTPRPR